MAAKPEAAPAKEAAKEAAPGADAAAPKAAAAKPMAALLPVIAVIVLAPVLSFAIGQFVLIPQLKKQIATMPAAEEGDHAAEAEAHAEPAKESGGHGKKGEAAPSGPGNEYMMENIVVNLAGTMGTRYLKTSFLIKGTDKNLRATFEAKKPEIVDISLNVLSSLSLADLEEAGAKNIIREKLILAYNQAIGRRVAEQIYFADFVVQ